MYKSRVCPLTPLCTDEHLSCMIKVQDKIDDLCIANINLSPSIFNRHVRLNRWPAFHTFFSWSGKHHAQMLLVPYRFYTYQSTEIKFNSCNNQQLLPQVHQTYCSVCKSHKSTRGFLLCAHVRQYIMDLCRSHDVWPFTRCILRTSMSDLFKFEYYVCVLSWPKFYKIWTRQESCNQPSHMRGVSTFADTISAVQCEQDLHVGQVNFSLASLRLVPIWR